MLADFKDAHVNKVLQNLHYLVFRNRRSDNSFVLEEVSIHVKGFEDWSQSARLFDLMIASGESIPNQTGETSLEKEGRDETHAVVSKNQFDVPILLFGL